MRVAVLLITVFISCGSSIAQAVIPSQLRAQYTLNGVGDVNGLSTNEMLFGIPLPPGEVIGNTYLDLKWNKSRIMFYENEKIIEGLPVKYNIKEELLEIKTKYGVKVLEAARVKSFMWADSLLTLEHYFINGKEYKQNGSPLSGFLEVLSEGSIPLLKRTAIIQKDPNYIAALDVGSTDTKLIKKETFYFAKGTDLKKIGTKKSLLQAFGEHSTAVEQYIKENKLDLDRQNDLAKIFEFYNSKAKPQVN